MTDTASTRVRLVLETCAARSREARALALRAQITLPAAADRNAPVASPRQDEAHEPVDRATPDADQGTLAARTVQIAFGGLAVGGWAIIHGCRPGPIDPAPSLDQAPGRRR